MSYQPIAITQDILEPAASNSVTAKPAVNGKVNCVQGSGQRLLEYARQQIMQAPDGEKHKTLVKVSYLLGGAVAGGFLAEAEAIPWLEDTISSRDVDNLPAAYKTIRESLEAGKEKPLQEQDWTSTYNQSRTSPHKQAAPQEEATTPEEIAKRLMAASVDFSEALLPPAACLEIEQDGSSSIIGTRGNFSLVIGKAKSKKTFFITIALAAAVSNGNVLGLFKGTLPQNKNLVLYFDTEQGKYHVQKASKRVLHMAGNPTPDNFRAYGLRKYNPQERLEIIEHALYATPNIGLVVIDGIRDLISSINDEEQATMIASKLLKWTEELDIHIMCVLHQNKGDTNARGHIGSELQNKAETVLSITKDPKNKEMSIVDAEYCREKEFEPFAFDIDNFGIPQIVENWNAGSAEASPKKPSYLPIAVCSSIHGTVLRMAFENEEKLLRNQLLEKLKYGLSKHNIVIGDNKVKDYITYYVGERLVIQEGTPGTKNSFYKLNLQPG